MDSSLDELVATAIGGASFILIRPKHYFSSMDTSFDLQARVCQRCNQLSLPPEVSYLQILDDDHIIFLQLTAIHMSI